MELSPHPDASVCPDVGLFVFSFFQSLAERQAEMAIGVIL